MSCPRFTLADCLAIAIMIVGVAAIAVSSVTRIMNRHRFDDALFAMIIGVGGFVGGFAFGAAAYLIFHIILAR